MWLCPFKHLNTGEAPGEGTNICAGGLVSSKPPPPAPCPTPSIWCIFSTSTVATALPHWSWLSVIKFQGQITGLILTVSHDLALSMLPHTKPRIQKDLLPRRGPCNLCVLHFAPVWRPCPALTSWFCLHSSPTWSVTSSMGLVCFDGDTLDARFVNVHSSPCLLSFGTSVCLVYALISF